MVCLMCTLPVHPEEAVASPEIYQLGWGHTWAYKIRIGIRLEKYLRVYYDIYTNY